MGEDEQNVEEKILDEYGYDISHVGQEKFEEYYTDRVSWHYVDIENREELISLMKKKPHLGFLLLNVAHNLRPMFGLDRKICLSVRGNTAVFSIERQNNDELSRGDITVRYQTACDLVEDEYKPVEAADVSIDMVDA